MASGGLDDADLFGGAAPAAAPSADTAPSAPAQPYYDERNNVGRNPDGSIAYIGAPSTISKDDNGAVTANITSSSNPDAIASYLKGHPGDPANHLKDAAPATDADLFPSGGQASTTPGPAPIDPLSVYPKAQGAIPQLAQETGVMLRAIANGATLGGADRLAAGTSALPALLQGIPAYQQAFSQNLTQEQMKDAAGREAYPITAFGGSALGAIPVAAALPEIPTAGILGRGAVAAGQGALLGGTQGALEARGDIGDMGKAAVAPALTGAALAGPLGAVLGRAASSQAPNALADYAQSGVDPILAINGGTTAQKVGQALKGLPVAGIPLQQAAERTTGQVANRAAQIAGNMGETTNAAQAGGAVQEGARQVEGALKAARDAAYQPVNAMQESAEPLPVENAKTTIGDIYAKHPNTAQWLTQSQGVLGRIKSTLEGAQNGLTFGEMKQMRTDIGNIISDHKTEDVAKSRLKKVYDALTDDLTHGAEMLGGEEGKEAFAKANASHEALRRTIDDVFPKVTGENMRAEDVYNRIAAAASKGGRADIAEVRQLKGHLPPSAWNEVGSTWLNNAGQNGDHFSGAKLATSWGKLSDKGRDLLFGKNADDINALVRVINRQTQAAKFYNSSNTAHTGAFTAGLAAAAEAMLTPGGAGHKLGALGLTATLGYAGAKLLASPGFARLVINASRKTPQEAAPLFGAYAASHPEVAQSVNDIAEKLPRIAGLEAAKSVSNRGNAALPVTFAEKFGNRLSKGAFDGVGHSGP